MKRSPRILVTFLGLAALAAGGGCVGGYVDGGSAVVYGDVGYGGPLGYEAPWYDEGGGYIHPPHGDDHRGAPVGNRGQPHAAPSIPSAPRPSGGSRGGGGGGGKGDHRP